MNSPSAKQRGQVIPWLAMFGVLGSVLWGMSLTLPAQAGATGIPPAVVARAQAALANMKKLAAAMDAYADDFRQRGVWPKAPSGLFPGFVDDPTLFWHPGDIEPAPTTINSDEPNGLNSAQISYEFVYDPNDPNAGLIIRDWSSANNDGFFMIEFSTICGETTFPPQYLPVEFPVVLAQKRLRGLAIATCAYITENGKYPPSPLNFWNAGYIDCPRLVWHPGDIQPQPTDLTTDQLDRRDSVQISFEFLAANQDPNLLSPNTIIWQGTTTAQNSGAGLNVILADGSVRFDPIYDYNDPDGDMVIGQQDFDRLVACFFGPDEIVTDDFCRHFDRDQDHDVDLPALADFMQNFGN